MMTMNVGLRDNVNFDSRTSEEQLHFRRASSRDLPALVAIESDAGRGRWTLQAFAQELAVAWSHLELAVTPTDAAPRGFLVYWVVAEEVQLLNIATAPAHRRRGIGTLMMRRLLDVAATNHANRITLEVRSRNSAALALYQRFGFETTGRRKCYYGDDGDDAVLMELDLGGTETGDEGQ